jgi:NADH-quinone oxidoreductase subunit J
MASVAFVIIAGIAIGSALGMLVRKNPIHSALFLVVNLGSIAAFYLMMGLEFLAFAQVIVYAGAIMVLFVFAIMVLIPGKDETGPDPRRPWRIVALPVGALLLVELVLVVVARRAGAPGAPAPQATAAAGVQSIGRLLFTDYLFPFELTSVLLLAAMVGVLLLTRRGRASGKGAGSEAAAK